MSTHRAPGRPTKASYPADFMPSHCAGESCFHAHPSEPAWGVFAGLNDVVIPVRCDRKATHGAHDFTGGRCPGFYEVGGVPAPRVVQRAAQARAALRGGVR